MEDFKKGRRKNISFEEFESAFMKLYKNDNFNKFPSIRDIQSLIGGSYTTLINFNTRMLDKLNDELLNKHEMMLSNSKKAELENMISLFISKAYEFVSIEATNKIENMANIFSELKEEKKEVISKLEELEVENEQLTTINEELLKENEELKKDKEQFIIDYSLIIKELNQAKEEKEQAKKALSAVKLEIEELKALLAKEKATEKEEQQEEQITKTKKRGRPKKEEQKEEDLLQDLFENS